MLKLVRPGYEPEEKPQGKNKLQVTLEDSVAVLNAIKTIGRSLIDIITKTQRLSKKERHILEILRDGPRHGLGISEGMENIYGEQTPGTLYPTIKRLQRRGLIEEKWENISTIGLGGFDGRTRRRFWCITTKGEHELES